MAQWLFRTEKMDWVQFKPADTAKLEAAWAAEESGLKITVGSYTYAIDLVQMTQTNERSGKVRFLRRKTPEGQVSTRAVVWEWQDAKGHFTPYDRANSEAIEKAYALDHLLIRVNVPVTAHDTKTMVVHFGHMYQHPDGEAASTRRIRRTERALTRAATTVMPPSTAPVPTAPPAAAPAAAATPRKAKTPPKKRSPSRSPPGPAAAGGSATLLSKKGEPMDPARPKFAPVPAAGPALAANPGLGPGTWTVVKGSVLALPAHNPPAGAVLRVAAFDMDDTLIRPKSMDAKKKKWATFPKSADDWDWLHATVPAHLADLHARGYMLLIVSNQGGIAKDPAKKGWIQRKVLALQDAAKVPISFVGAMAEDANRKPGVSMWDAVTDGSLFPSTPNLSIDHSNSFYCGDAAGRVGFTTLAGREKDFSCSDRKFAFNVGVRFFTPEVWLVGCPKQITFHWDGMGPGDLETLAAGAHPPGAGYARTDGKPEMVVMVGWPGSGKSTFFRKFLEPHGYVHANRDTLKSLDKCCKVAHETLAAGKSVCIDNTSPDAADRKVYLNIARKYGAGARIFHMKTTRPIAWHLNLVRAQLGIAPRVSSIAYNVFKGKFVQPDAAAEGFDEVVEVPLVPDLASMSAAAKRLLLHTLT